MEQVFFHTHSKISQSILRHSSHRFRSTIEHLVLGLAVCGFCVVLLGHVTFVHRGDLFRGMAVAADDDECSVSSDNVGMICEVNGGVSVYSLLVRLLRSGYVTWLLPYSMMQRDVNSDHVVGNKNIYMPKQKQIPTSCLMSIPGFSEDADVTHILLQMENKDRLLDQNSSNSGSRAFTLHSSGSEQSEWIVTGMHPLSSSVTQRHLKCAVIQKDPTTAEQNTKRKERRGSEKIPECPTEITALLSEYGYLSTANNITNNQSTFKEPRLIYSYSHAQGLLILSPKLKQEHNISTQFVIASSSDANCFGEPFIQSIVFSLAGPDTVILNWILGLQQHISRRSDNNNHHTKSIQFVHHWKTSKEIDLDLFDIDHYAFSSSRGGSSSKYYAIDFLSSYPFLGNIVAKMRHNPLYRLVRFLMFKLAVFLSTLFIFFLTTSLVSFTFQETQDRMLEFTLQLQTHVRARLPLGGLIVRHILENVVFVPVMVGMIFFLIEFYEGDKFLAFMVLTIGE
jgi:hypothetical protein